MKIGRNDPCPCGSGKKYKQCCFAAEANPPSAPDDLRWRRMRRLLDDLPRDMLRFVESAYGPSAIKEALQEFTLWPEDDVFELDPCHTQVFMPWFFHHWSPDPEETEVEDESLHSVLPTVAYLRSKGRRLDPMLVRYLESCVATPFSFLEALRVDPGHGVRLRDILIGEEHEVFEHSASIAMQPGDIIFGQVGEVDGMALLEAYSRALIPPIHKRTIIELRMRITAGGDLFGRELLHEWDAELLELYHELSEQVLNPTLPRLQNTDGDPLSLQQLVFDIDSPQQAFDALKHLALDQPDDELLEDAERDAEGKLLRVSFDWRKRGNRLHKSWDNTILGRIEIDGARLSGEVNSEQRANALRELIEKSLGGGARYRATKIQSVEKYLADGRKAGQPTPAAVDEESKRLADLPEVKAKLAEILAQHYESWLNESIPALGGRTPLEAVKDPDGREVVESLVFQIERDGPKMRPSIPQSGGGCASGWDSRCR